MSVYTPASASSPALNSPSQVGLAAARPAAGTVPVGFLYYATDTNTLSESNGAIWTNIVAGGGGIPGTIFRTAAAGFAKVNGTPNILTFNTPNDGNLHAVSIAIAENVVALETGGQVSVTYTVGGHASGLIALYNGGAAAGFKSQSDTFIYSLIADPNTAVTLLQSTALTAGGPTTVWAELVEF